MNTMLATDGLGQTEASTQDLHPGLPQEWQEPKSLSLYLLLPRHVNRSEWEQRQDSRLAPRHSEKRRRHLRLPRKEPHHNSCLSGEVSAVSPEGRAHRQQQKDQLCPSLPTFRHFANQPSSQSLRFSRYKVTTFNLISLSMTVL